MIGLQNSPRTHREAHMYMAMGLFCSPIILMTKPYPDSILCFGGVLLVVTDHIQG